MTLINSGINQKLTKEEYSEYIALKSVIRENLSSLHQDKMELYTHYMIRYQNYGAS